MKYDCSKTLDYWHEQQRMCKETEDACAGCPIYEECIGDGMTEITQEVIDKVQAWSDSHQVKRRQDLLIAVFPNVQTNASHVMLCPKAVDTQAGIVCEYGCEECCEKLWLTEVEDGKTD